MSARQDILERIRNSRLPGKVKPGVPDFSRLAKTDFLVQFRKGLEEMASELVEERPSDFAAFPRSRFPNAKNFCSAVPEFVGNSTPEDYSNWAAATDIDVALVYLKLTERAPPLRAQRATLSPSGNSTKS
jgi:hypothetical protein